MSVVPVPLRTIETKFGPVELRLHAPDSITAFNDAHHTPTPETAPLVVNGVAYGLNGAPMFPHPDGSGLWIVGSKSTYEDRTRRGEDRHALHQARYAARVTLRRVTGDAEPTNAATEAVRDELERCVSEWCREHFTEGDADYIEAGAYRRAHAAGFLARRLDEQARKLDADQAGELLPEAGELVNAARVGVLNACALLEQVERGEA